jgi:DNA-binding GntR family transcriptional regulator
MNQQSYMKKPPARDKIVSATSEASYEGVARVAFEIGKRQAADLRRIRDALDAGDNDVALALMRNFFVLREGDINEAQKEKTQ